MIPVEESKDQPGQESLGPDRQEQEEEIKRLRDQMLRLQAEFENARKRWLKEQAGIQEEANADLLRQLLEIFDDFQRALESGPQTGQGLSTNADSGEASFRAGVEMIARRMESFLKSYGLTPVAAVGKPFDPALHEAVAHEVSDSAPESMVVAELRRGYMMNGRVLRPSVVKVSVRPADEEKKGKEEE